MTPVKGMMVHKARPTLSPTPKPAATQLANQVSPTSSKNVGGMSTGSNFDPKAQVLAANANEYPSVGPSGAQKHTTADQSRLPRKSPTAVPKGSAAKVKYKGHLMSHPGKIPAEVYAHVIKNKQKRKPAGDNKADSPAMEAMERKMGKAT